MARRGHKAWLPCSTCRRWAPSCAVGASIARKCWQAKLGPQGGSQAWDPSGERGAHRKCRSVRKDELEKWMQKGPRAARIVEDLGLLATGARAESSIGRPWQCSGGSVVEVTVSHWRCRLSLLLQRRMWVLDCRSFGVVDARHATGSHIEHIEAGTGQHRCWPLGWCRHCATLVPRTSG